MPDNFHNKDYIDYFNELEKKVTAKPVENNTAKPSVRHSHSKSNKRAKAIIKKRIYFFVSVVLAGTFLFSGFKLIGAIKNKGTASDTDNTISNVNYEKPEAEPQAEHAKYKSSTITLGDDVDSKHAIVIETDGNSVVAAKDAEISVSPASTTKIMTLLVAAENIKDFNDTFTMTYEITDPLYKQEASVAGFLNGETVTMTDLLYGTILPSGADAAIGLAIKIAGSEQDFVKLMNKKADELKLTGTHFTNPTGLYNKQHYCTVHDMAVILAAAMKNELCRKILSTYQYTTSVTPQHPEGITLSSTLFSYMYGTEPDGADIKGGKTGFVNESGYCIATFGQSDSGKEYISVIMGASSKWPAFYDQINLYTKYAK